MICIAAHRIIGFAHEETRNPQPLTIDSGVKKPNMRLTAICVSVTRCGLVHVEAATVDVVSVPNVALFGRYAVWQVNANTHETTMTGITGDDPEALAVEAELLNKAVAIEFFYNPASGYIPIGYEVRPVTPEGIKSLFQQPTHSRTRETVTSRRRS